jgi:hypothetical protein
MLFSSFTHQVISSSHLAMGIAATIQSGIPGGDFFHGITVNFTTPWLG